MIQRLSRGIAFCCLISAVVSANRAQAAEDYVVDGVHSTVLFRVKHLGTSYAWGRFNGIAGKVSLSGPSPSVDVQVNADSIDTGNANRDKHLKSPDFFNVKQFPTIAFKSTQVKRISEERYEVEGTLSLHGVNRPIKVMLDHTGSGKNQQGTAIAGFETTFPIKRSDFGMKFLLEGISDDVHLIVSLECGGK